MSPPRVRHSLLLSAVSPGYQLARRYWSASCCILPSSSRATSTACTATLGERLSWATRVSAGSGLWLRAWRTAATCSRICLGQVSLPVAAAAAGTDSKSVASSNSASLCSGAAALGFWYSGRSQRIWPRVSSGARSLFSATRGNELKSLHAQGMPIADIAHRMGLLEREVAVLVSRGSTEATNQLMQVLYGQS
jgi:hypothetical protein